MSSHHFVKEGQEPSVWVLGTKLSEERLGTLLEWSPKVFAKVDSAHLLHSLQIKIDVILSDQFNEDDKEFFTSLYPLEWIEVQDIDQYVIEQFTEHPTSFYLVGYDEDELQNLFRTFPKPHRKHLIGISPVSKWTCPSSPWSKWLSKGQKIKLHGNLSLWKWDGELSQVNDFFVSDKDQLIKFNNEEHQVLEEFFS